MHKRILAARDQILAHSDLTVKQAELYVSSTVSGKCTTVVQNLIHGTEEFSNRNAIINLIEQTLDSMYAEVKRLEATLPVNTK